MNMKLANAHLERKNWFQSKENIILCKIYRLETLIYLMITRTNFLMQIG